MTTMRIVEALPRSIREAIYRRQTGRRDLTPRQRRRADKKEKRATR
jgi:hypothetical protein